MTLCLTADGRLIYIFIYLFIYIYIYINIYIYIYKYIYIYIYIHVTACDALPRSRWQVPILYRCLRESLSTQITPPWPSNTEFRGRIPEGGPIPQHRAATTSSYTRPAVVSQPTANSALLLRDLRESLSTRTTPFSTTPRASQTGCGRSRRAYCGCWAKIANRSSCWRRARRARSSTGRRWWRGINLRRKFSRG